MRDEASASQAAFEVAVSIRNGLVKEQVSPSRGDAAADAVFSKARGGWRACGRIGSS